MKCCFSCVNHNLTNYIESRLFTTRQLHASNMEDNKKITSRLKKHLNVFKGLFLTKPKNSQIDFAFVT